MNCTYHINGIKQKSLFVQFVFNDTGLDKRLFSNLCLFEWHVHQTMKKGQRKEFEKVNGFSRKSTGKKEMISWRKISFSPLTNFSFVCEAKASNSVMGLNVGSTLVHKEG